MPARRHAPLFFGRPGAEGTASHCLPLPLQVAKGVREVTTPRAGASSDLAAQLAAWAEGGCRPLGGEAGAHLAAECDRLLRDKAARQRHAFYSQRAMVHALLSGYNRGAEAVVKVGSGGAGSCRRRHCSRGEEAVALLLPARPISTQPCPHQPALPCPQDAPTFFPTIEDFLWFKLSLVRPEGRVASVSFAGGASCGSAGGPPRRFRRALLSTAALRAAGARRRHPVPSGPACARHDVLLCAAHLHPLL